MLLVGLSTVDCIKNGIALGCAASIEGIIAKITSWLRDEHDEQNIRVIATGGNAQLVADMLDSSPVVEEHAVLRGTSYLFSLNSLRPGNLPANCWDKHPYLYSALCVEWNLEYYR